MTSDPRRPGLVTAGFAFAVGVLVGLVSWYVLALSQFCDQATGCGDEDNGVLAVIQAIVGLPAAVACLLATVAIVGERAGLRSLRGHAIVSVAAVLVVCWFVLLVIIMLSAGSDFFD